MNQLIVKNGNIYDFAGEIAKKLKKNGLKKDAHEMFIKINASNSIDEAIKIILQYQKKA